MSAEAEPRKKQRPEKEPTRKEPARKAALPKEKQDDSSTKPKPAQAPAQQAQAQAPAPAPAQEKKKNDSPPAVEQGRESKAPAEQQQLEHPGEAALKTVQEDISRILELMNFPSLVSIDFENGAVLCRITGEYEEEIIGPEGRTLDSLQYLVRKMTSRDLPDQMMIDLDAGNFRDAGLKNCAHWQWTGGKSEGGRQDPGHTGPEPLGTPGRPCHPSG